MSEHTIWTCDGCEKEKVINPGSGKGDWGHIDVTLDGFYGYPVGEHGNETRSYHLCPACQRRIYEAANPRNWARARCSPERAGE